MIPPIRPYDLPDSGMITAIGEPVETMVWTPDEICIVLGQGTIAENAIFGEQVADDGIPLFRRPSGGETVLLSPKTMVVSVALRGGGLPASRTFFEEINRHISHYFLARWQIDVVPGGISDLTVGDRKIMGSAIYRRPGLLFYHGVLNVGEDPKVFGRYLRHPVKEPDYRDKRRHEDFVTSLEALGMSPGKDDLIAGLSLPAWGSSLLNQRNT